jgi:hypothetical protein
MQQTGFSLFIQQSLRYGFSLFGLPKTGQRISYRAGDDGEYEKGYPKSGVHFVDNNDGTVTDMATGLMWVKEATSAGCNNGATISYANALTFCENLDFAGHTDWRLPNIHELLSIQDYSKINPAIALPFTAVIARFWSSTKHIGGGVWGVYTNYGYNYACDDDEGMYGVRPVRGG